MPARRKELRRCYGFDEVAIVPGEVTLNPDQTNIDLKLGELKFDIPVLAAAMDAVTDVNFTNTIARTIQQPDFVLAQRQDVELAIASEEGQ